MIVLPLSQGPFVCEKYKGRVISAEIFAELFANGSIFMRHQKKKRTRIVGVVVCYSRESFELRIPNTISRKADDRDMGLGARSLGSNPSSRRARVRVCVSLRMRVCVCVRVGMLLAPSCLRVLRL